MKAKTFKAQSTSQLAEELARAVTDDFQPTLAVVFLSIRQNHQEVCAEFSKRGLVVFGATTAGEFIDGEVAEGSAAVMLLDIDPACFQVLFVAIDDNNPYAAAQQIGKKGKEAFAKPAFLVSYSGLYTDGETLVKGIEEAAGDEAVIFGGMAGDDLTWTGPCVFTNGQASEKAVLAVVINGEKILLKGHAVSGWKPVGTERTITKSNGSVVYTIDDEPALDVVMKFLGIQPETPNEVNDALVNLGAYFPILMQRNGSEPVVRTSMFANVEDRSMKFNANVPEGTKFRFSLPPDFDVVDKVIAQSDALKKSSLPEADALIMFSCVARHVTLGPMITDEIEGVKNLWQAPLVGFFSYGEMGKPTNGQNEFHSNTCCLVAMKEKGAEKT